MFCVSFQVTNAWICASYAFSESDIKCRFPFSGNISCAWQAFPADKYFVHARMLHEYHILATNLKVRVRANKHYA